jgi:peptide/nickel transport system substrate-binding protein
MRRLIAACFAFGLLLAGCSHAASTPGVLRMGESDEPDSLNLMFAHSSATDQIDGLLFTHLFRYDAEGNAIPDLALAFPTSANGGITDGGKTITLHLRKNVRWSDGAPETAADWIFTYHAVMNPRNNVKSTYGWELISSVSAPDPYTIVIHLKHPSVAVLGILGMGGVAYPPLPAHLLAKLPSIDRADFNQHPISSGPFVLENWEHGARLTFVPNAHYWRGEPKLRKLIWQIIPDTNSLLAALQTHEIDMWRTIDDNDIPRLNGISGIAVTHRTIANWRHLGINLSRPGLSDIRVRQALAAGIDWARLNATVYHGINTLARSDIFPQSWAAPSLPAYRYDPSAARALLRAAGYTTQHPLQLTISATNSTKSNESAEVYMQSQLRPLGIALSVHNYPPSLLFAQDGPMYKGTYDLEWSIDTNAPDPDDAGNWNSTFIPPKGANTSWLRDAQIDRLTDEASSTFDRATRKQLYQQESERIRALVPAVFFYWETGYYATSASVRGFKPAAYEVDTWNAWEWSM